MESIQGHGKHCTHCAASHHTLWLPMLQALHQCMLHVHCIDVLRALHNHGSSTHCTNATFAVRALCQALELQDFTAHTRAPPCTHCTYTYYTLYTHCTHTCSTLHMH